MCPSNIGSITCRQLSMLVASQSFGDLPWQSELPVFVVPLGKWKFASGSENHGNPQPSFLEVITHILGV